VGEGTQAMSRRSPYLDPDFKKKPQRQRSVLDKKDRTTKDIKKNPQRLRSVLDKKDQTITNIKKKPQRQRSVLDRKDRTTKNIQKKISALKRYAEDDDGFDDNDADADASAGAGKAFGGREEKQQGKNKTKKWRSLTLQLQLWLEYWYAVMLVWRVVLGRAYRGNPRSGGVLHEWEPNNFKVPEIAAVHRDVVMFRRDNGEDFVPGELYIVDSFRQRLIASCRVTTPQIASVLRDVQAPSTFQTEKRRSDVTRQVFAKICAPSRHAAPTTQKLAHPKSELEIRKKWYRIMFRKNVPKIFWDYGMRWVCETISRTHTRNHRIDGGIPLQKVTDETVDISNYIDFEFYDYVECRDNAGLSQPKIGRWLGVSHNVGSMMTFYVLTQTGQVISRSSVERVKDTGKGRRWNPGRSSKQQPGVRHSGIRSRVP
jgi:hypothetical protein